MSLFSQTRMYWRFARDLRKFLKEPVTLEQSRQIIKQRLEDREKNLLTMVKRTIYENEASPYLKLLKLAGCEYGDFEQMVRSDGIEAALRKLSEEGVYISVEEFKGKEDVTRGGRCSSSGNMILTTPSWHNILKRAAAPVAAREQGRCMTLIS